MNPAAGTLKMIGPPQAQAQTPVPANGDWDLSFHNLGGGGGGGAALRPPRPRGGAPPRSRDEAAGFPAGMGGLFPIPLF